MKKPQHIISFLMILFITSCNAKHYFYYRKANVNNNQNDVNFTLKNPVLNDSGAINSEFENIKTSSIPILSKLKQKLPVSFNGDKIKSIKLYTLKIITPKNIVKSKKKEILKEPNNRTHDIIVCLIFFLLGALSLSSIFIFASPILALLFGFSIIPFSIIHNLIFGSIDIKDFTWYSLLAVLGIIAAVVGIIISGLWFLLLKPF